MVPTAYMPSSRLSYQMLQELRKRQGQSWFALLTLSLPGGNTLRYAYGPGVAQVGAGQFDSLILEIEPLARAVSDRGGSLVSREMLVTVDDTQRTVAALLEGRYARQVQLSPATLVIGSPAVPSACWYTAFSGVVWRYSMPAAGRWQCSLATNRVPLDSSWPRPRIDEADFPNAPDESLAQYGPLLYGTHDSRRTTNQGAIPLVYVNTASFDYMVSWGWARAAPRVYADGVIQGSGWSLVHPITNSGRRYTAVRFAADKGDAAITADAEGYEDVGDGSGDLIDNPALQLKHLLVNWVYGDYKSGAWLADSSAPVDVGAFLGAAAYFRTIRARGSRRFFLSTASTGLKVLNEWSASWEMKVYWNDVGQLAVRPDDLHRFSTWTDERHLRFDDSAFDVNLSPDWDALVDRVTISYFFSEAEGKYLGSVELRDPTLTLERPDSLEMPWSEAK